MAGPELYVVVPCFNEEKAIAATLESFTRQTDPAFRLVLVDNNSTDRTLEIIEEFKSGHPALKIDCVFEPQKGTGAAADTGFRYAIARNARFIARTDADC